MNEVKKIRDPGLMKDLSKRLASLRLTRPVTLMEVCGTHTMAIHRAGLPSLLPPELRLLSGPGCPVCVTPASYLDTAIAMARRYDAVLATFGDMMRVPGSSGSLAGLRSEGYSVEIVYSPLSAIEMARSMPGAEVVFLAVGFETTAPVVASSVLYAREHGVENFSILSAHKLVMPALELLISDRLLAVDGFMLPGHVSAVLGSEPYRDIAERYHHACVITGFETADIIQGILMLADQIERDDMTVAIQYSRVVKPEGNKQARAVIDRVFEVTDSDWRGFGMIPSSGLALRDEFRDFDAALRFPVEIEAGHEPDGCRCGEILKGHCAPPECPLFARVCRPESPVGPCMVSGEGTCAAFFKYSKRQGAYGSD
ncbi:hydrogenase formation protein HypD [bacterium]|nr:hydrogenase formation protein HypD [bacterium]